MISINNLSVNFGGFDLFKEISFLINEKDRIGLVGKNGAGKSTLLKIIYGIESPSSGSIAKAKDISMGYLPQQMELAAGNSVKAEAEKAFIELNLLEKRIDEITRQISERTDYESKSYHDLINQLSHLNERLEVFGAADRDALVEQTLKGLGFEIKDFERQTTEFSGGWRMRIELAKILLQNPDVLLLDEPTNHLDIESIQWLEDFLKNYRGAVVMVSHDRAFLDNISKRTIEISLGKIYDYRAPYSKYLQLRKERIEQQRAAYENQQKMIQDTEKFIERFRYKATKAVQVQSRIKQLEKLERIEIEEEDKASIQFQFPPAPHSGTIVVETENLSKRFGNLTVFENIDLVIERGEKVAFVGKNGEGKTTLSRIIVNELDYEGKLKIGHKVKIGYYAQNQDTLLDKNRTVFQTLDDIAVGDVRKNLRSILGSFLFSGDTVDKKVAVLSGGERSRLALAKLLLEPYNLLVLDEPTNHLDIRSKEILKNALLQYDGTLIVVSHDREFLDGLTEKLYEFRNKNIKEYRGGIYDFLKKRKLAQLKDIEKKNQSKATQKQEKASEQKLDYLKRKEIERNRRKIINKIEKAEAEISNIEEKIAKADELLSSGKTIENPDFYTDYEQLKQQLELEMQNWENLQTELEEFEKNE
ncbi:MAG: ABC-F family ATP-binding cassette domain-containing protein [Bacteroidales bacterium]|nr:ABC-F family ATP-binding cassette domain-containing protein [Bacteroidales bacterium]